MSIFAGALRVFACLVLFLLVVTPFTQIILRGVFNIPMGGAEEWARYMLICLAFMAGALVTIEGGQIRMEEVQAMLPERPRWLLQLLIEVISIAVFGFIAYAAFVTIANNMSNQTATLEMPFWIFMAPLAIGTTMLCLATALLLHHTWRRGRPEPKQTTLS